jgi:hypothetical protein
MALSAENQAALIDFSKFGRRRREQCVAEVAGEFKETREMRLFEDHYTKDDVDALMDGLLALVRTTLQKEMKGTIHSSLLLIKQTLEQAEAGGVKIGFDVARAQDKALLREVEQWETKVAGGGVAQLMVQAGGSAPVALGSVGVAQDAMTLMVRSRRPATARVPSCSAVELTRTLSLSLSILRSWRRQSRTRRRWWTSSRRCRCSAPASSRRRARSPPRWRDCRLSLPRCPGLPRPLPSLKRSCRDASQS